jgi:N-acetylglucosaminyldiphosphoundecaprenol N-acetyl-beta-D-mannosaminyltransferase
LLNTSLDAVTLADTVELLGKYVDAGQPQQIVTLNVDLIKIAQHNERFRAIVNTAALSVADGTPLLWAARWTGQHLPARITGTDLVLGAAQLAAERGETMFFLGAAPGVAAQAAAVVQQQFPGVRISTYSPPMGRFSADDNRRMVDLIWTSGAKYVFVALGSPRGQIWLDEHLHQFGVPVCAEIGSVFNFLAGTVRRAPQWMQRSGLEWLYRILQEPRRLWRRYILDDLPVFAEMLRQPLPGTDDARPAQEAAQVLAAYEPEAHDTLLERAVGGV